MVAVDANVLLRHVVRDDEKLAAKADAVITKARPGSLLLERLIIAECTYVLRSYYQFDKADIADWLVAVLGDARFAVPDRDMVERAAELFAAEKPLSFEDSWLLALQRAGTVASIATFDNRLNRRAAHT